jgi:hypothetical protein
MQQFKMSACVCAGCAGTQRDLTAVLLSCRKAELLGYGRGVVQKGGSVCSVCMQVCCMKFCSRLQVSTMGCLPNFVHWHRRVQES